MKEVYNIIAKNSRSFNPGKSMLRKSLEKSSKLWMAPLAILSAAVLIYDAINTWKSSTK